VSFSAFPYIGSKTYLAPWIVEHFAAHKTLVVPFGGAAGVLLNKRRSACEIFNDRDGHIVHFFETCRQRPDDLADAVRNIPYSRELYDDWSQSFRSGEGWPEDDVERAARWLFLRYASFSGRYGQRAGFATDAPRGGPQKSMVWRRVPERIATIRDRFQGVAIECLDYRDVFDRYDDSDVLFYCDPPYVDADASYYRCDAFNHASFVDQLAALSGEWVVSYAEFPPGLTDVATTVCSRSYSRSAGLENEDRQEQLALSYDLASTSLFVDDRTHQETLGEWWDSVATDGGDGG
jgi:DNA adenine methylase